MRDHQFCFRLDCPNALNGTELTLPYWFADSQGAKAQAELSLPFCSIRCLFQFVANRTLNGIMEEIVSTHWRHRRKEKPLPDQAPDIRLNEIIGDPVITKFVILTSWKLGNSHAIISLPFNSPEMAARFWEQCGRSYYLLLRYLFEHETKDQEDRPIPASISFVVPVTASNDKTKVIMPFSSLADAHQLWQSNGEDVTQLLRALLQPK